MSNTVSNQTANHVPDAVAPVAEIMSSFPAPWALCGGWAIDAWLGRQTREHQDVDVIVFVQDRQELFEHLSGWQLVAHGPDWAGGTERWDGRPVGLPGHIHGRPDTGEPMPGPDEPDLNPFGFYLDIQLNDRSGDDWLLCGSPRISVPLDSSVRESPWGLPAVAPEVLLFYKSLDLRRRDKLDFAALLPELSSEQRDWLRETISLMGHPWLAPLSSVS